MIILGGRFTLAFGSTKQPVYSKTVNKIPLLSQCTMLRFSKLTMEKVNINELLCLSIDNEIKILSQLFQFLF